MCEPREGSSEFYLIVVYLSVIWTGVPGINNKNLQRESGEEERGNTAKGNNIFIECSRTWEILSIAVSMGLKQRLKVGKWYIEQILETLHWGWNFASSYE